MKNVLIVGGGFAGLSAAALLARYRKDVNVVLADKSAYVNSLPLLPDVIGRGIPAELLTYPIKKFSDRHGFRFLNKEVLSLDTDKKEVTISLGKLTYDYVLVACGSETNFYGNDVLRKYAYKLDDFADAKKIRQTLETRAFDAHIIAGGGYTGIEIATNLRRFLNGHSKQGRIIIVERAPAIVGPLPEWMKRYVSLNLERMGIEVLTNTVIDKTDEGGVTIAGGTRFENTMLIWAAGVNIPGFVRDLKAERTPQGRLKVDEYLRVGESCYAAGDAAYFSFNNNFIRMGVQFALAEGARAAQNIINSIQGKAPVRYRPIDLGYVIPMANNFSCGSVLGVNMRGKLATVLHYCMCIYRSYGFANKSGILNSLLRNSV